MRIACIALAATLLILPKQSRAELPEHLTDLDYLWLRGVADVCVNGNYIYTNHRDDGLRVLDASDPQNVHQVAHIEADCDSEMECNGQALVVQTDSGLDVYSLENPELPVLGASLELDFLLECFTLDGQRLALCGMDIEAEPTHSVLSIYDISNPLAPDPELYYTGLFSGCADVKMHGERLYIASLDPYLTLVDLSDPNHPQVASSFVTYDYPLSCSVEAVNGYVYVGVDWDGIYIFDEETLGLLTVSDFMTHAYSMKREGNRLHAITAHNGRSYCIFDLSSPLTLFIEAEIVSGYIDRNFALGEDCLVLACGAAGAGLYLRPEPGELVRQCFFSHCGPARLCRGYGDRLAVLENTGLRMLDLSLPTDWQLESSYFQPSCWSMVLHDEIAYLMCTQPRKLMAVDLHDPSHLSLGAEYFDDRIGSNSIASCGEWLVASMPSYLMFFHAGDIDELDLVCEIETGLSQGNSMIADGEMLIVRDTEDGRLAVFDCSSYPQRIQLLEMNSAGVSIANHRVYCLTDSLLQMAEIGAPDEGLVFQPVMNMDGFRSQCVVAASNERMLMSYQLAQWQMPEDLYQRLGVFDNSNPQAPVLLESMVIGPEDCSMDVSDNRLSLCYGNEIELYDVSQILLDLHDVTPGPTGFVLHDCVPNPFNPSTTLDFTCPRRAQVRLAVYNLLGRRITTLADQEFAAGEHQITWQGRDTNGRTVASGSYFIVAEFPDGGQVKLVTLLK